MSLTEIISSMDTRMWILTILLSIFLTLVAWEFTTTRKEITYKRVVSLLTKLEGSRKEKKEQQSLFKRINNMAVQRMTIFLDKQMRRGRLNSLKSKLEQADIHDVDPLQHWAQRIVLAVLGSIVGLLTKNPGVIILLAGLGIYYPGMKLKEKIKTRQEEIAMQLPDFLDLVAATFPACPTLEDTLRRVCERTEGPLVDEFRRMLEEVGTGRKRHDALRDLAMRCGIDEMKTMVSQINQSDVFGTGLDETLRIQAERMRKMKRFLIEQRAKKAGQLLLLPSALLLFTAMILLVGPSMIEFLEAVTSIQ